MLPDSSIQDEINQMGKDYMFQLDFLMHTRTIYSLPDHKPSLLAIID